MRNTTVLQETRFFYTVFGEGIDEGTVLLILATPTLLFYLEKTWRLSKQAIKMTLLWYISPVISVIIRLNMYLNATQAHFVRKVDQSFQIGEVFDGLVQAFFRVFIYWFEKITWIFQKEFFSLYAGLFVVICITYLFLNQVNKEKEAEINRYRIIFLLTMGVTFIVLIFQEEFLLIYAGLIFFMSLTYLFSNQVGKGRGTIINRYEINFLFTLGATLIILGFLPYALTEKLRYRYDRTLIIPWIGASIIFITILWLFFKVGKQGYITFFLSSLLIALSIFLGLYEHRRKTNIIQMQNAILAKIVEILPKIEEDSIISLIYDHDCWAGAIKDGYCPPPSRTFEFDKIFTGSLQYIYDDTSLRGLIHQYSIKSDVYLRGFKGNRQAPLENLIIIRYSPERDEVIIESEVPLGLIESLDLNTDEYAPSLLYDSQSKAPYRACLLFPDFFSDKNACLAAP